MGEPAVNLHVIEPAETRSLYSGGELFAAALNLATLIHTLEELARIANFFNTMRSLWRRRASRAFTFFDCLMILLVRRASSPAAKSETKMSRCATSRLLKKSFCEATGVRFRHMADSFLVGGSDAR